MNDARQIQVKLSNRKLTLMLIGSIIFVGLGVLFMINPSKFRSSVFQNTSIIFIAGLVSVLFFGLVGFSLLKKLADKKLD